MSRSSKEEQVKRINAALDLLEKEYSASEAARELADRYGISQRQAYRYVQQAQEVGKPVPVPERKIAFTVKLSGKLVHRLRQYAQSTGLSLSEIVTRAVEAFLKGRKRG